MKKFALAVALLLSACSQSETTGLRYGSYKLADSEVPAILTLHKDGKANGKVVNLMMGNYTLGKGNRMTISPMATTMMMGSEEEMNVESKFLKVLPTVTAYKMRGDDLILITDTDEELVFESYNDKDE